MLTVTLQLQTGPTHTISPAAVRPARRDGIPGSQLLSAGSSTLTAMSVAPTKRTPIVFVLHEGPAPGQPVTVAVIPAPFPDDGRIAPYEVRGARQAVQAPCVSLLAFFIDGIGDLPQRDVLVWYREGEAYTSFRVNRRHTVRVRPVVRFETRTIPVLANRTSEYVVATETTGRATDFLMIAVARKPDGEYLAEVMSPLWDSSTWPSALHQDGQENWEWRFYALDDRPELHSHCRG